MIEVKVTLKNGEIVEINPVKSIVIDNGYCEYGYIPEEIKSIEICEVEE
jgi:hypothetical protein